MLLDAVILCDMSVCIFSGSQTALGRLLTSANILQIRWFYNKRHYFTLLFTTNVKRNRNNQQF